MAFFTFPITIGEHQRLFDAYAQGGQGEAVRVFHEIFPDVAHEGFAQACTRQLIGSAWDFAKPSPANHRPHPVKQ